MAIDKSKLTELELTDEQVKGVLKLHAEEIDGNYVPKHRFNEKVTEVDNLKAQEKETQKTLKELKKVNGDAEEIQKKLDELEESKKQSEADYKKQLQETKVNFALKEKLMNEVVDVDVAMGLFDKTKITLNEKGEINGGFEDTFKMIKTEKQYLLKAKDGDGAKGIKFAGNNLDNPDKGDSSNPDADFVKEMFGGGKSTEDNQSIINNYMPNSK